jgi:hypothetical protein
VIALTHCFLSSLKHSALDQILKASHDGVDKLIANLANSQIYDLEEVRMRLMQLAEEQGADEDASEDEEDDMSRESEGGSFNGSNPSEDELEEGSGGLRHQAPIPESPRS